MLTTNVATANKTHMIMGVSMDSLAWFVLACAVFGFIVYVYVASAIRRKKRLSRLPNADPPLLGGRTYNVQLSHGRNLDGITVVGIGA